MKFRRNSLDCPVGKLHTVADLVFKPIELGNQAPLVVDVGARNGMQLLPASYCRRASLIGFEPNPAEHEKLMMELTDAHKIGAHIPKFLTEKYVQAAIWSESVRRKFFVTVGPGAATLMGHALPEVVNHMYLNYPDDRRLKSFGELHSAVQEEIEVDCLTLDDVVPRGAVCDFLKLDVEGAELRCLQGAHKLLTEKRILFVYSEFVTFPYYKEHCVLGDQHTLLNDHGYRLLDIELGHACYTREISDLPNSADRNLVHAGDAFYCIDPDRNELSPLDLQRLAAISFCFGFNSFALSLLSKSELNSEEEIHLIKKAISKNYTLGRAKKIWSSFPTRLANAMRKYF